jgi:hypothetical protein
MATDRFTVTIERHRCTHEGGPLEVLIAAPRLRTWQRSASHAEHAEETDMEWLYWIMLFVGAVVLSTGCLILAQGRRQERIPAVREAGTEGS